MILSHELILITKDSDFLHFHMILRQLKKATINYDRQY